MSGRRISEPGRVGRASYRDLFGQVLPGSKFMRASFYNLPGGLRFELSESGPGVMPFMQAMRKGRVIVSDVFAAQDRMLVCLVTYARGSRHAHRKAFRELADVGIRIPRNREVWLELKDKDDWYDEAVPEHDVHVAFEAGVDQLELFLWCAFAVDFGIRPNPKLSVYLLNPEQRVMAFPYDDRGVDVVGPNHEFLSSLYHRHRAWLLDYDMNAMRATFETDPHSIPSVSENP